MKEKQFKMRYEGSLFWLIFWIIFFFPIALVLLFSDTTIKMDEKTYRLKYRGSVFWACFWMLFFFPIAFILLLVNGFSVKVR